MDRVRNWWAPTVGIAATLLWLDATMPLIRTPLVFRVLALLLFATSVTVRIASGFRRNRRWSVAAFVCGLVLGVLPIDISIRDYPGSARLVPFVIGLPAPATADAARRGDVMLAGCVGTEFDPSWVLVW